jgi:hypothetical protein
MIIMFNFSRLFDWFQLDIFMSGTMMEVHVN